jgi:2-keto-4-pentenoate hydratase/2-oxohepta-3-ene-1,7-dioic acid hydratase in catechol pathway
VVRLRYIGQKYVSRLKGGPWLTRRDAIWFDAVRPWCEANGEGLQDASANPMAFGLPELIDELSLGMTLRAGDILLAGTPAGAGACLHAAAFPDGW